MDGLKTIKILIKKKKIQNIKKKIRIKKYFNILKNETLKKNIQNRALLKKKKIYKLKFLEKLIYFFSEEQKKEKKISFQKNLKNEKKSEKLIQDFKTKRHSRQKIHTEAKKKKNSFKNILKNQKNKKKIPCILINKTLKQKNKNLQLITLKKYTILRQKIKNSLTLIKTAKKLRNKLQYKNKKKNLFYHKINWEVSRIKKTHQNWEKTKQRIKNERKIKKRRNKKTIKKLKHKKMLKIKTIFINKNVTINNLTLKNIKKIFNKKAKTNFQKKKRFLQNNIFIKRKNKNKKLIIFIYKTKKWNIQLNNKTSKKYRNKRKLKRIGWRVKKNKIFSIIKKLHSGSWNRRRKKIFKLKKTLKTLINKINNKLPNNLKNYLSSPTKKNESMDKFTNNFTNNINILSYRLGIFPSISLSIAASKKNWICTNFETQNNYTNLIKIGDNLTLYPSFFIFSNYIWMKQLFIKQIFANTTSTKEFYSSKKPFLCFFIKINCKNLTNKYNQKDWIKTSFLNNLKLGNQ